MNHICNLHLRSPIKDIVNLSLGGSLGYDNPTIISLEQVTSTYQGSKMSRLLGAVFPGVAKA
jgi:hypothetical protein